MSATTPYKLEVGQENTSFEFVSEGSKGSIEKLIQFEVISKNEEATIYNLAFGDKDVITGELDDLVVSDNGDTEKVLSTVAAIIILFLQLQKGTNIWVYATGSTSARTRLYRMGINKYYDIASAELEIYGEIENGWEPFRKGITYNGFLCRKMYI